MPRENYSSGTQWEPVVGYSRAVKVGGDNACRMTVPSGSANSGSVPGVPEAALGVTG